MRIKEMIICCVCLIHLLGIEGSVAKEKAVPVEVIEAKIQKIEQEISVTGDICAFNQVVVYSKVNGVIEELKVEKGDRVKKGDVLAIVEHNMELSQKAQAEAGVAAAKATIQQAKAQKKVALASLKQAEAQLELAKLEKERITQLFKNNTVSKQQYDEVMAKYKVSVATRDLAEANLKAAEAGIIAAEAGLQQALAQLKQIEIRIQDYYIRAPISGIISKRFVDEGAMDSPQQPIVEITQMDKVKVITEVAEKDIALIRPGLSAEFNVESYPEKTFTGKVVLIDGILNTDSTANELLNNFNMRIGHAYHREYLNNSIDSRNVGIARPYLVIYGGNRTLSDKNDGVYSQTLEEPTSNHSPPPNHIHLYIHPCQLPLSRYLQPRYMHSQSLYPHHQR